MELVWPLVGAFGLWLIECSYLPQLARLHRRKLADDLSPLFPAMNLAGRLLALAYTAHLGTSVLALGFLLGVLVRATFLSQVLYYRHLRPHLRRRADAVEPNADPTGGSGPHRGLPAVTAPEPQWS